MIRGIRPAALDDLGLRAALEELTADLRDAGIETDLVFDPSIDALAPTLQTTIYRIAQESLNNARKHSGSRRVNLSVRLAGDRVDMQVTDTGRGFSAADAPATGFGLTGIRERTRLAGGECLIDTAPGAGARIQVRLPVASHGPAPEA